MTTVLYFQNLALIQQQRPFMTYPKAAWRFANSIQVPKHIKAKRWFFAHDSFYGLIR